MKGNKKFYLVWEPNHCLVSCIESWILNFLIEWIEIDNFNFSFFPFAKAILCRTSSYETKVRQATKGVLRELNISEMLCICRRAEVAKSCRNCLLREVCDRLLNLGYNCAICKSKWRSSPEIPSGIILKLPIIQIVNEIKAKQINQIASSMSWFMYIR